MLLKHQPWLAFQGQSTMVEFDPFALRRQELAPLSFTPLPGGWLKDFQL